MRAEERIYLGVKTELRKRRRPEKGFARKKKKSASHIDSAKTPEWEKGKYVVLLCLFASRRKEVGVQG